MSIRKGKMEIDIKKSPKTEKLQIKIFYVFEISQGFQIQIVKMVEEQTWHIRLIFGKAMFDDCKIENDV